MFIILAAFFNFTSILWINIIENSRSNTYLNGFYFLTLITKILLTFFCCGFFIFGLANSCCLYLELARLLDLWCQPHVNCNASNCAALQVVAKTDRLDLVWIWSSEYNTNSGSHILYSTASSYLILLALAI